jgi:PAS domain S-box-containing protein
MKRNTKTVFFNTIRQLPTSHEENKIETLVNIFKGVEEYVLDSSGVIVSSNLEAVTITGYEEWEIIGRHFSIFYSIEDQVKRTFEFDLDKAERQGYSQVSGIKMKKRNSPFWAKMRITAIMDDNEIISGYRLTIQDASHKAIYSHNLSLVKDEYLNLFNNPFIGIFKFRISDSKLLLVNEKAESLFGKDWSKHFFDSYFIHSAKFQILLVKIKDDKRAENFEFEILNPSGTISWVSVSCKLFSSVGFVEGVIMDITEKKRETEKLLNLSNELESFIYHASHDLRSPITSIFGLVNLLKRDNAPDKLEKYPKLIEGRLHHLDHILRDIVEIAFNTAAPIQSEKISFETEIRTILNLQSKPFPHVRFSVEVQQPAQVEFFTDLTRLRSILRNVISNSFKYSNSSMDSYIKINVEISRTDALIVIKDNGIGIQAEYTEKIFSLFYKATESHKGNGLGLYIVKSMVDRLGGKIDLESSPGVGTTFKITLPCNTKTF